MEFFSQGIQDLISNLLTAVPYLLYAIMLLFVGWLIARFCSSLVKKLLEGLKVDKLAEKLNNIDMIGNANIKILPSIILSKVVYYFLLFIFLIAATEALQIKAASDMLVNFLNYIPILLSALIIFVIGLFVADAIKKLVYTAASSLAIPAAGLISNLIFYFLFINVLMVTLAQARINTDFIQDNISIVLGGIVLAFAIGYGLASKELAANFISSFYNKEKIKLGNEVSIDGKRGKVVEIGATTFTIATEQSKIIIPLSRLTSESLEIFG